MNDKVQAKQRILDTARSLFAEKGFDGARVDQIALQAGVNKALIYYYFKNKQALLDALIDQLMTGFTGQRESLLRSTGQDAPDFVDRLIDANLDYLIENRELISIVFMEDLKNTGESIMMKIWKEIFNREKAELNGESEADSDSASTREVVTLYFYNFMPLISFLVFGNDFSATFGVSRSELREQFRVIAKRLVEDVMNAAYEEE